MKKIDILPGQASSMILELALTFMVRIAIPRMMKNPQVFVGAGFKPALRRKIDLIRPGNALGGFETRPYETVLRSNVCDVFHAKRDS